MRTIDYADLEAAVDIVCRSALVIAPDPAGPRVELDRVQSQALFERVQAERLVPLLTHAVNLGEIVLHEAVLADVLDRVAGIMTAAVRMEAGTIEAIEKLELGGVTVRVTKGLATAHLDYSNPALRQFGDVDLLVPPGEFDDAMKILSAAGIEQKRALRGDDWRLTHSIELDAGGFELDLHHRLLHQAAGQLTARLDLFEKFETFEVGGRPLRALPEPLRLLQAAGQNVLSDSEARQLSSDVDVMLLCRALAPALAAAQSVHLSWMMEMALERASQLLPNVGRQPQRGGAIDALLRRVYAADDRSAVQLAAAEAAVAPPALTLRMLRSVISPGDAYLGRRGRSKSGHLLRQLRRFLGRGH